MDYATLLQVLDSTVRLATPLLLACLAGLFSERAGIFDIGLEGKMLIAAFFSAATAYLTGSVWLGLLAGIAGSLLLSAIHGLASITFRGNQLISGVALNFLASGLTVLVAQTWFAQGGRTPTLEQARFSAIPLPGAEALRDVPVLGPIYAELISGHSILVYAAFLLVPLSWWVLYRTRFGLRLRAVGENHEAAHALGYHVVRVRFLAILFGGACAGLGGAYISLIRVPQWTEGMTAGIGWIALALVVFASWKPWRVLLGAYLFGGINVLQLNLQAAGVAIPVEYLAMSPYLITILVLVILSADKSAAPASLGRPFHASH